MIARTVKWHLDDILTAWAAALTEGAPKRWLCRLGLGTRTEIICADPMSVRTIALDGTLRTVALKSMSRRRVAASILAPPSEIVLRTNRPLPQTALPNLDEIVRLDIPVSTPFDEKEILFAARPRGALPNGQVQVEIALVLRDALVPWLDKIRAQFGAIPGKVALGERLVVPIDPGLHQIERDRLRLDGLLCVLAIVLATLIATVRYQRQDDEIASLRQQINSLADEEARAMALRGEISDRQSLVGFVEERRKRATPVEVRLAAIGALMQPTYRLSQLQIVGDKLSLNFSNRSGLIDPEEAERVGKEILGQEYSVSLAPDRSWALLTGTFQTPKVEAP